MERSRRFLWLALASAIVAPSKSQARTRADTNIGGPGPVPHRQGRRRVERTVIATQNLAPVTSPCGRHVVSVSGGAVYLDGRPVHPGGRSVYVLAAPAWRKDGEAVAWLERGDGQTRLMVMPELSRGVETLPWLLPRVAPHDQLFWAARNRVVVGPALFEPRAVASWTP